MQWLMNSCMYKYNAFATAQMPKPCWSDQKKKTATSKLSGIHHGESSIRLPRRQWCEYISHDSETSEMWFYRLNIFWTANISHQNVLKGDKTQRQLVINRKRLIIFCHKRRVKLEHSVTAGKICEKTWKCVNICILTWCSRSQDVT